MGTYTGMRVPASVGLSVLVDFKAKLYPFEALDRQPVVNDRFKDEDLVVVYSKAAKTASVQAAIMAAPTRRLWRMRARDLVSVHKLNPPYLSKMPAFSPVLITRVAIWTTDRNLQINARGSGDSGLNGFKERWSEVAGTIVSRQQGEAQRDWRSALRVLVYH